MTQDRPVTSLDLSPEDMRRLGHEVIDRLVEHWRALPETTPIDVVSRADAEGRLAEPPPAGPSDPSAVLDRLYGDVLSSVGRVQHPRFFAFVPGPNNFVSVLAETLAAGHNVFVGSWLGGSAATALELVTMGWLRDWVGYPKSAGGLFVSGGSMANLTALTVARDRHPREDLPRLTAYASDQTHSAVARALDVLGFSREALRLLPSDGDQRLPVAAVAETVARDRAAGLAPCAVIANAGTTNTGAVDPMPELADLCAEQGLWLHVDGAYGAAAALCDEGRRALVGLDRADSLALDPHKWLFQPFEMGCVLVRDEALLPKTFSVHADYLDDLDLGMGEVNLLDHGVQLSRSFRALKLWLSVQVFGLDAFRDGVARGLELARRAEELLAADGRWRITSPARLGVVTFRHRQYPPGETGDAFHQRLTEALRRDGYAFQSTTRLGGSTVLRLCTINPRTTDDDLRGTVERLGRLADGLA